MTTTPPPATPPTPPVTATPVVAGPPKVLSLIGMIAGIVGVVFSLFGGWGFVFSIAAVVLGFIGKSKEGAPAKGFWLTAIITGFAGIALSLIWLIVTIGFFVVAASVGTSTY